MAYKMQTGQTREVLDLAARKLDEMEKATQRFHYEAASFADALQDDTSREALSIVYEIFEIIKRSRKIIEESGKKAGEGVEKLELVEARARKMGGKI